MVLVKELNNQLKGASADKIAVCHRYTTSLLRIRSTITPLSPQEQLVALITDTNNLKRAHALLAEDYNLAAEFANVASKGLAEVDELSASRDASSQTQPPRARDRKSVV